MEALSVARPVVGYDVAGLGELIAEGWVAGVPPGAPAAVVARQLVTAMSACPTAAESRTLDRARLPTWDSCADQLAKVYLSSVGHN